MKKLLVVGAGFLQSSVIRKAVSMGYETLTVDKNPNAVGFADAHKHAVVDIVDEKACLEYAKKEKIDGVITAATDFGVLSVSYIAEHLGLACLSYETAKMIKNKYRVRKRLYESRVDDAEQAYEVDCTTDLEALSKALKYPVMVKPCDGSGSRGASRVDDPSALCAACERAMDCSITRRAEIESFIFGEEYGVESLVAGGKIHILAIMKKTMTKPPYYAELGHAYPAGLPADIEAKTKACVRKAIKALGIDFGSVNMDVLVTPDGKIYIIDVGARMGGNLIGTCIVPYGTGIDYTGAMIRNAMGDPVDMSAGERSAVVTKLLAFDDGIVKRLPDMKRIEKMYDVEIYHQLAEGMRVNEYHTNLDGRGYIVAKGTSVEDAGKRAAAALETVKKEAF